MSHSIYIRKVQVNNKILKNFISNYWFLNSDGDIDINHKILPVRSNDIIFSLNEPISYQTPKGEIFKVDSMHVNSIKTQHLYIHQQGKLRVMGITFNPLGIYPYIKDSMDEIHNSVGYDRLCFNDDRNYILESLYKDDDTKLIDIVEKILIKNLKMELMPNKQLYEIVNFFCTNLGQLKIDDFCKNYGVSNRWLERNFNKYIGISPKAFLKLCRFQESIQIIKRNEIKNLTALSHENNFFDQSHFTKDFKNFAGCTPSKFKTENSWIKNFIDC